MLKRFIGNKAFYKVALAIAIPIMIQQGITAIVNLVDNFMVGSLGDNVISGVATVNQILFVPSICLVGGLGGPGIYLSQFYGAKNKAKLQETFRIKALFSAIVMIIFLIILSLYSKEIISLFVDKDSDVTYATEYAIEYMSVMIYTLIPLAIIQLYGTSLRETKHTKLPMISGIISIFVNIFLNYILIFGNFGFEPMGVKGAAIATLIARIVDALILVIASHLVKHYSFCDKAFTPFTLTKDLLKKIVKKGTPLLFNEFLWSLGMTMLFYAYSERGNLVVNAYNISSAVANLFFILFSAVASAIAIMVGNELGAGNIELAKDNSRKLIFLGVMISIFMGFIMFSLSFIIPKFYNVSDETRKLAKYFLWGNALFMWLYMFNCGCFYTIRSGGQSMQTLLFDSGYTWIIQVPIALALVKLTSLDIITIFILVQLCDFLKLGLGIYFVKKEKWAQNLTTA